MREDGRLRKAAVAPGAVLPKQEPVPCPKVDGLAYGEAMGEASVVGARKGHNEFARLLHSPAHLHTYSKRKGKLQLRASRRDRQQHVYVYHGDVTEQRADGITTCF